MALVTVSEFDNPTMAQFAKLQLELGEIEAVLIDLETISMDWFLGGALGLIKLQAHEEDVEQALGILAKAATKSSGEPSRSTGIGSTRMIFWGIVGAILVILVVAAIRFAFFSAPT